MINVSSEQSKVNQMLGIKNDLETDLADLTVVYRDLSKDSSGELMSLLLEKVGECKEDFQKNLTALETNITSLKKVINDVYNEELAAIKKAKANQSKNTRSDEIC